MGRGLGKACSNQYLAMVKGDGDRGRVWGGGGALAPNISNSPACCFCLFVCFLLGETCPF